ncbi:hypothetical protein DRN89_02555 [archaeon]|nr:MAG: hypothetical protein DRN89_02555 [archaeon]
MTLVLPGKYLKLLIWDNNFSIQQRKEGKVIDELKELIQLAQQAVERLECAEKLEGQDKNVCKTFRLGRIGR